MRDKLIFELEARRFALDTSEVDKVLAVDRLSYLPGQRGIIGGVVSLGGEPVAVVDARRALKLPPREPGPGEARKVVVMRSGVKSLALDIGAASVTFHWAKAPVAEDAVGTLAPEAPGPDAEPDRKIEDKTLEPINWLALFDEAAEILKETGA